MRVLEKRVQRLEGGPRDEITVVARTPPGWPKERQVTEVEVFRCACYKFPNAACKLERGTIA